jgi:outer membrane protein assembly factor BamB
MPTGDNVASSPAIGRNGMVYVASKDDSVYAFANQ